MLMATMFLLSQSEYDQSIKEKQFYMGLSHPFGLKSSNILQEKANWKVSRTFV